jgi:branched-chain amino acid transport system permease protein
MFALSQTTFQPSEFATFEGVVWLAVLVTWGVRSNAAALLGGVSLALLPAITQNYLPTWTSNVTPVLFGLGAVSAARYPDGVLAEQSRRLRRLVLHVRPPSDSTDMPDLTLAGADVGQVAPARMAEQIS